MKARGLGLAALSVLAFFGTPKAARADDTQELEGLLSESVVEGASKSSETVSDAPATVSVITADDMHRYGIRSLNEAIDYLGMGLVTQDPLHSVEIGGRGVLLSGDYGNHVLVVVDGHAINEPWNGTAYFEQGLGIPIELIDHIELILGPGSVLYGGTAMLGVIHVVTKNARAYKGVHLVAEGGVSPEQHRGRIRGFSPADGSTYRLGGGAGAETLLFGSKLSAVGQVEFYAQNGPAFLWGPQVVQNEDGTPTNFGVRTRPGIWGGVTRDQYYTYVPTAHGRVTWGDFTLSLHAESYRRATPAPGFAQAHSNFDDAGNYELDRWLWADLLFSKHLSKTLLLTARGYADTYDYAQRIRIDEPSVCSTPVSGDCRNLALGRSRWGGAELRLSQDWLGDDRLTTMIGTDVRVRRVTARYDTIDGATGETTATVGDRSETDWPVGVYVQQRWRPWTPLFLNGGARYDHDPRGGDRISPRLAATVQTWRGASFKTVYAEAFRPPSFYEFYYASPDQEPNPNLKSETVRSLEGTFEQRFGAHRILFGAFWSSWNDMVQLRRLESGLSRYDNTATIDNYGFNTGVEGAAFGAFRYGASLTGATSHRHTPEGSQPLTVAPQVFGNARVSYDLPGDWPTLALASHVVGSRLADRALDGAFPVTPVAPPNLQTRFTVSGPVSFVPGLSYRAAFQYATASVAPYVAGPNQSASVTDPAPAELTPINRMSVFATLHYDFQP